jgi:hypothetical protein
MYLLLRRGTAARDPLLDADMMCGCVCEPVRGTGEVCEREATLQIRPVELLCGASHELPKRVMGPELFLDVREKGTYLAGYMPARPFCDWTVAFHNSGSLLLAVSFKNLCPLAAPSTSLSSLFSLSRHESLSQGLFPPPGRLVIYTVPRVNPRTTLFSLAAPTVKTSLGTVR